MNSIEKAIKDLDPLKISWQKHALQRMFERSISTDEVKFALKNGEIIEK